MAEVAIIENGYGLIQATIANGASVSGGVSLGGRRILGVIMPAAWTSAGISFQLATGTDVANTEVWNDVYDAAGVEVAIVAANVPVGRAVFLPTTTLIRGGRIRVRSGVTGAPVVQGGQRSVQLITSAI